MLTLESSGLIQEQVQLALCFCLFGFLGTVISTSLYLKWQNAQTTSGASSVVSDVPLVAPATSPIPSNASVHGSTSSVSAVHAHHRGAFTAVYQQHYAQYSRSMPLLPFPYPQLPPPHVPAQVSQVAQVTQTTASQQHSYHKSYPLLPAQPASRMQYVLPRSFTCNSSTQIFLDWDDTLFPTAYTLLNMKQGKTNAKQLDSHQWQQLDALMETALHLLFTLVELYGADNVCIVTNASSEWWNDSCHMYHSLYAQVRTLIVSTCRIQVVSAHDRYARNKSCAFMDLLRQKRSIKQVICIGDSLEEFDAVHTVCSRLRDASKRSIHYYRFKLLESPSLGAMIRQLQSMSKLDYFGISQQLYDQSYTFK